jgi:GntR family transcriptional regulator of vanillate catabolism
MSPAPRSRQQIQALLKLRELILTGAFAPGERVSELAAVTQLGISRTPVRLALTLLEHEGLLSTLPGGGFIVRDFSVADIHDSIEIRGLLEGMAVRRAAERRLSAADLEPIRETLRETDNVVHEAARGQAEAFERYVRLNDRFHRQLLELAESPMLGRSLTHIESLPFASPNAFVQIQSHADDRNEILMIGQVQHRSIVEAIALGEGARAEALAREHARLARRNLATAQERLELMRHMPGAALVRPAPLDDGAQ